MSDSLLSAATPLAPANFLLRPIGDVPPAEFEQAYYNQLAGQAKAA